MPRKRTEKRTENGQKTTGGKIVEIKGVVIDAVFHGELPSIYNALRIEVPEQDGRPDDVEVLGQEMGHQRSSRMAIATRLSIRTGQILSIGPSGSIHSPGTRMPPITIYTSDSTRAP